MSVTINDLETAAREYAAEARTLRNLNESLQSEIEDIKSGYFERIKAASVKAGEAYQTLLTLVNDAPDCFAQKKSMSISGVKFGYQKKKGSLEIMNEPFTIKTLRELFPDIAATCIKTKETLSKKALEQLSASNLKQLGVSVINDTDVSFVKLVDDEVQKLIEAMVKESAKMAE